MSGCRVEVLRLASKSALAFALAWAAPSAALDTGLGAAATMTGVAKGHDGDDVRFGKVRVRLQGIVAPEDHRNLREPGGPEASKHLRNLVDDRELTCLLDGETAGSNMRPSAICYLDDQDIGEAQVRAGHARDCPRYSGGRYAEAEAAAKADGNDLSAIYPLPEYCVSR